MASSAKNIVQVVTDFGHRLIEISSKCTAKYAGIQILEFNFEFVYLHTQKLRFVQLGWPLKKKKNHSIISVYHSNCLSYYPFNMLG